MTARDLLPIAVFAAVAALLPVFVTSGTWLNFAVFTLIVTLAAQGWNILGGYGGQYSFGHAAFFGTAAYATALLQVRFGVNPYLAFALGVMAAGLVGWIIGLLSFRSGLRGSYFALVTLAFAEVFRVLANASAFTGGAAGILIPLDVRPGNFQFASRAIFYWVALALVVAALLITRTLERARLGAHLVAVRENEDAARALGVDALAVKLSAIALSAAITGAAGALYAQYFLYLDSNIAYGTWISVEALLGPIVGGAGTAFGPVIGGILLHSLGELARKLLGSVPGLDLALFGVLLILVVRFPPRDIPGLLRRRARR